LKVKKKNIVLNILFLTVAGIILAADQYTKYWINANLPTSTSIEVIPNLFYITHIKNTGAAFGLFPNGTNILIIISIIAIIMIIVIKIMLRFDSYFFNIALGLILGGALGNLVDRYLVGEVTDFLYLVYWPIFNIADSSAVIGFIIMVILLFKEFFKKDGALKK